MAQLSPALRRGTGELKQISQMGFSCIYINIKNLSFWIQKKT